MLGAPFRGNYQNWPSVGEIDILEAINGVNTVYATLHCGTSPGGPCNETSGISGNTSVTAWGQWHTYRMEFDKSVSPQELRFYIDGSRFHTVRSDQVDATTWNDATNHGFFVILNVAIGGGWPGNPTSSTVSGGTMLIDYVRIYTASGGSSNPTPTPTPVSGGSNLALNRPVTASSTENNSYPAGNAVDGSTSTRWSSAFSDPQWLRVDLGSTQTINRVVLRWETAYGRDFQIQTSNDGNNWTTIRTVSGNTSTTNDLSVSSSGRYIRMYGTARATQWGYSLYEFEVYGSGSIAPTPTPTSVPAPTSTPSSGGRDAYSTIEAESYNTQSGTQTEATSDTGGGLNVGWIANGDWLRYDNVNFGSSSPITVQARLASGVSGGASGLVEFHLDSRTGPTIATIAIGNTGGWQSWTTVPMNTSSVTGTRTVYIVFASGQSSDFVNINWFYFTR
ncbi:MAG: carbohydrate-binding protein [Anaerolineae bacterium]|nr:carbohydrate-binding protein [Anaerolineae bacterium]